MEPITVMGAVFAALQLILQAIETFRKSGRKSSDQLVAIKEMGPLFEQLEFCKYAHNTLQEFKDVCIKNFDETIGTSHDPIEVQPEWDILKKYYCKKIQNQIILKIPTYRSGQIDLNQDKFPISIKAPIFMLITLYPQFLNQIKDLNDIYNKLDKQIRNQQMKYFDERKIKIRTSADIIIDSADGLLINLISILIFYYDEIIREQKN